MSDEGTPPAGDTPDYKALYEAELKTSEKYEGQYKKLQKTHNKTAKIDKTEYSQISEEVALIREELATEKQKSIDLERGVILAKLKPELQKKYKKASKETLEIVLEVHGIDSGFPIHESKTDPPEKPQEVGWRRLDQKWEDR